MWNRVKYFITDCSTSCMFILLSATRFGKSLWHYNFRPYKMCYSTSSHIWNFVTPWPPWRRRFPAEIGARWRYRPSIKNMSAHYDSQFCVSFNCCLLQEAQNDSEKDMKNFTAIFFTWQWLTKYIFSSINKNTQSLQIFCAYSWIFLTLLLFKHLCHP